VIEPRYLLFELLHLLSLRPKLIQTLFKNSLYSDLNFYFGFSFFEGPLKHLSQEDDLKMLM